MGGREPSNLGWAGGNLRTLGSGRAGGNVEGYTDRVNHYLYGPLVRWDGAHVVLNLGMVEEHLRHLLRPAEQLQDMRLNGLGNAVRIDATVVWKGLRARVGIELGEIRLKHRRLGLRLRRVRALGGVRVPRRAVEALLSRIDPGLVRVVQGQGIVIVDLDRWIPPELSLSVLTVQATERSLHLWLGPGDLRDLPVEQRQALTAGDDTVDTIESQEPAGSVRSS